MKKRGLIVATIVMVLVLAVSLTTATYAWFTVSEVTTIQAFDISVVANNAVNIGVKSNNEYAENPTADMFLNGTVTYTPGTAGKIGGGNWTDGAAGLGSTLNHGIMWGAQSAAVGLTTATLTPVDGSEGYYTGPKTTNTYEWDYTPVGDEELTVIAANAGKAGVADLTQVTEAVANKNGKRYIDKAEEDETPSGDYAYLFLGASPTKKLTSNELVIMITGDQTQGSIVGILSAVHVAYRLNGASDWEDVELFGDGNHYNTLLNDVNCNLTTGENSQANAYNVSYGKPAPTKGAWAIVIDGLTTTQGEIDQIEIVIYIAGADSDCRDEALGAVGSISIFFNAIPDTTQNT